MSAISGTRRQVKELVDGTLRVTVDIDPTHRATFWELFPNIDMPIALAPLFPAFEHVDRSLPQPDPDKPGPVGPLCLLAVQWCKDPQFQDWMARQHALALVGDGGNENQMADMIRVLCNVDSRRELDATPAARNAFNTKIRWPYMKFLEGKEI